MFDLLIRWLKGYLFIDLSGTARDRFIKLCNLNNIFIWKFENSKDFFHFCVSKRDFSKIQDYAKKTNCDLRVIDKRGLPFFMYKYKKRKCFLIGVFLFLILILYSNIFIWKIDISGSDIYTREEILSYVNDTLVKPGTKKSDVNCKDMEFILREQYSKIAWISCYIKGTELHIEISDTIDPDKIESSNTPCNIVAIKDCSICEMITKSGTAVVEQGEAVTKGQILISGVVEIYNDYDELVDINFLAADGYVYGEVIYNYKDSFSVKYYEIEYTGNEAVYYSIAFADKMCTPYIPKIKYSYYDIVTTTTELKINDTYTSPISFYKTTVKEYLPVSKTYSMEEATKKAEKKLDLYIKNLKKKGVEILENNVTIEFVDNEFVASGTIITKELIGVPQNIDTNSINDTNITDIQGE